MQKTRDICELRGWTLDEEVSLDAATSAYRGNNLTHGALGRFLKAVETKRIETPCVLVVEALDRLTRTRVRDARGLFEGLLAKQVRICTAHNNKLYDESSLDNPIDLMLSIFELNAAYLYAAQLGSRVSSAWTKKKELAKTGKLLTRRLPSWIKYDEESKSLNLIENKVKILKRIYQEYLGGRGLRLISLGLNKDAIPNFSTWGKGWSTTPIRRLLKSRSVIGDYQPCKYLGKNKRVEEGNPIEGYYPPAITKELFYKVQERLKARNSVRGARKHCFNLFSGLLKCKYCGSSMILKVGGNQKNKKRQLYIRVVCSKAWKGNGCKYLTFKYNELERGLITTLSITLMVAKLKSTDEPNKRSALIADLKDVRSKLDRNRSLLEGSAALPSMIVDVISKLEARYSELEKEIALTPSEQNTNDASGQFKNWQHLTNDVESRRMVQGMLSEVIKEVTLDPVTRSAVLLFRKVPTEFNLKWDDDATYGFVVNEKWQPYLDDILFWKSQWSRNIGGFYFVEGLTSPIGGNFGAPPGKRVYIIDGEIHIKRDE